MSTFVNLDRLQAAFDFFTQQTEATNGLTLELMTRGAHRLNELRADGQEDFHRALTKAAEIECGPDATPEQKKALRSALAYYSQLLKSTARSVPLSETQRVTAEAALEGSADLDDHRDEEPEGDGPRAFNKKVDSVAVEYKGVIKCFSLDDDGEMHCDNNLFRKLSKPDFAKVTKRAAKALLAEQAEVDRARSASGVMNYVPDRTIAERIAELSSDTEAAQALLRLRYPHLLELEYWRQFRIIAIASAILAKRAKDSV